MPPRRARCRAGPVGGELFVTIVHGGGLSSTYSWISAAAVRKGDVVVRGQTIEGDRDGHPGGVSRICTSG